MPNQYGALASSTPPPPNLGYGTRGEVSIDAYNQWQRAQPWYQSLIKSFGQDPSNVHLNDAQKQAVIRAAQANGVVVDEGGNGQEVDDSGNFRAKGHALRNTLIVAGIAGAALLTAGAAGAFSAAAAPAAAAPAAAEGGVLASTALPATGALATGTVASGAVPAALAAGAGGASVAAPAAAATAASSPSWLKTALGIGVPVAGNIIGAKIAADASKDASDTTAQGLKDALDFEKQQYADLTKRLDPYVQAGTASTDRMAQLLGLPQRQGTTAVGTPMRGPAVAPMNAAPSGPAGPPSPGGAGVQPPAAPAQPPAGGAPPAAAGPEETVMLVAPDGTQKAVPKSQVDFYLSKGAKPAQAAA